jgi:hypothetical protein
VWLEGLIPGATIGLRDGTPVLGSGESYDGNARFHLTAPLDAGMDIKAQQTACDTAGRSLKGRPWRCWWNS